MIKLFGKEGPEKEVIIKSPVCGKIVPIEKVPDTVFSGKIMGDGIAIEPDDTIVFAPVDGELAVLFPGGHAFGIRTKEGLEILVHIGIDTVELKGEGFKKLIKQGERVNTDKRLIEFDLNIIKQKSPSIISPIVITNMQIVKKILKTDNQSVKAGDEIMRVILK